MTTLLIDDSTGACDSMWSDKFGKPIDVTLNKYLFVPSLDVFENDEQVEKVGAPKVIFYCGSYEQIVLHQAFSLVILNPDQYEVQSQNAANLGYVEFGYVEIILEGWEPVNQIGVLNRHGAIYGGSGGGHAIHHYQNSYNVVESVHEAIKIDPQSAEPVSYYRNTLDGDNYFEHIEQAGNQTVQNIYSLAEQLIISMQTGELGGDMSKVKFSGCTTSSAPEAPPIDVKKVIQDSEKAKKKYLKNRHKHKKLRFRSDMEISTEKVKYQKIAC
ncbi:hypothetical protein [Vibrio sp. SCSIO 43137]|uniref:hypothetical protein n=1 Tax=Vibrio sp. SCSIO 43137 TaxID=3021011 RepID=UPI002307C04C|nr:hypothetical protein [Vibrio sp. SCSIO 43137]WCE31327.1 hypothetical protein PK654_19490 [Vibrio sp. SCSIO 43137]